MLTQRTSGRLRRLLTADPGEPRWANPAVALMMLGTAVLYLWNLTVSGWGNGFYAAVRAGSRSWTALLFGALDANGGITVDKPPAAYWIPGLFARLFGFSSTTVLLPQALMGIASVWVLYLAVRRTSGKVAGLIAGTVLALTPVAVMMFRFNNPDALLTLCLTLAAYCTLRALQADPARRFASGGWVLAAGLVLGLAFLVKMLQGLLIVPALAVVLLLAARGDWVRRLRDLGLAAVGLCLPVLGYAAVFYAWPADSRPYMAGTDGNSFWELVLGYNGLGRIFGGAGNGGGGGTMFGGSTGLLRMFNAGFGPEISWLLPGAAILLAAGLWFTRRAPRTDATRAALLVWGGWLVLTAGIFSFMRGTIHPYYVVALAPAVAALVGIGAVELWRGREHAPAGWTLAGALLVTVVWDAALLRGTAADWLPWLRWTLLVGGSLTAVALAAGADRLRLGRFRGLGAVLALAGLVFGGLGTAAWGVATVGQAHTGSTPSSGPAVAGAAGAGGPGGAAGGAGAAPEGADSGAGGQDGTDQDSASGTQGGSAPAAGGAGQSSAELTQLLREAGTEYSAATIGATGAAQHMLDSDTEVLDIGGWNGSDPYPTLEQFQQMVSDGRIRYFLAGGMGGGMGGGSGETTSSAILSWVQQHYTATTVDGTAVYDLSTPAS
ncbi:glycosyltransferase family 39 protein [Rothia kristinae]|uniref:Glycosyltransferase family 39 protein n=1 Tax=Rothia kristinae TaxID=37923 RepID=A0A7T4T3N8_9MICC|nr:glycosyltransferase family 39 protein [Rothia kristinae]QQC58608.1 glycosyltransferase family 39 protein [Rothia kristinae]